MRTQAGAGAGCGGPVPIRRWPNPRPCRSGFETVRRPTTSIQRSSVGLISRSLAECRKHGYRTNCVRHGSLPNDRECKLARRDTVDVPAYLESSKPGNVPLSEHRAPYGRCSTRRCPHHPSSPKTILPGHKAGA